MGARIHDLNLSVGSKREEILVSGYQGLNASCDCAFDNGIVVDIPAERVDTLLDRHDSRYFLDLPNEQLGMVCIYPELGPKQDFMEFREDWA